MSEEPLELLFAAEGGARPLCKTVPSRVEVHPPQGRAQPLWCSPKTFPTDSLQLRGRAPLVSVWVRVKGCRCPRQRGPRAPGETGGGGGACPTRGVLPLRVAHRLLSRVGGLFSFRQVPAAPTARLTWCPGPTLSRHRTPSLHDRGPGERTQRAGGSPLVNARLFHSQFAARALICISESNTERKGFKTVSEQ